MIILSYLFRFRFFPGASLHKLDRLVDFLLRHVDHGGGGGDPLGSDDLLQTGEAGQDDRADFLPLK